MMRRSALSQAEGQCIDWHGFAGLCDIVARQYFSLELPRLWPTVTDGPSALPVMFDAGIGRLTSSA